MSSTLPPGFQIEPQQPGGLPPGFVLDRRAPAAPEPSYDPSEGMTGMDKFLVGAGYATDKALRGLKGLVMPGRALTLSDYATGPKPVDQGEEDAKLYEKYRPKGWQTSAGEIAGAIGTQAPLALIPGALPAQMAIQGVGAAAMTPGDPGERWKEGAMAAGGTLGGQVLTKALGRVAKPIGDKAPDIVELERLGVRPTFGQGMAATDTALGKSIGRAEEAAQSVPLASGPLRRTREATMDQWRQASRNAALPPQAAAAGPATSIDDVFTRIGDAYKQHLDSVPLPYASVQYQPDMRKLSAGLAVTPEQRQLVQETFEQSRLAHMSNPTPGVQVTATGAQQVESAMKRQAIEWMSSGDPAQRAQGKLFLALAKEYGGTWRSALPQGMRAAVDEIDKVYPNALAIAKAGASVGMKASGGVPEKYTPAVLSRAGRSMDRTPNKRAYNRGEAPQQEMARLGERLSPQVNDSGTAERGMSAGLMTGMSGLSTALATGVPLALYGTKQFQDYMMGRALPEVQEAILRLMRSGVPLGGAAGAGAAQQFGE